MKQKKILFICILNILAVQFSFAQIAEGDTSLANQYLLKAFEFEDSYMYDSALSYYDKAAEIYRNTDFFEEYVIVLNYYGNCFKSAGDYTAAKITLDKALKVAKDKIPENPIIADTYNNIGRVFYFTGEYIRSLNNFKKALTIQYQYTDSVDPGIALTHSRLGVVYGVMDDAKSALKHHNKSLELRKILYGEKSPSLTNSYINIGIIYDNLREYDLSLEYYFNALSLYSQSVTEPDLTYAILYDNIGVTYRNKKEYADAMNYYKKALSIRTSVLDKDHPDIATSYNNLANIYDIQNEQDTALKYYFKSIEIWKKSFGDDHPLIGINYNNIGILYKNIEEYTNSIKYFEKSIETLKKTTLKSIDLALVYTNLADVYFHKDEYENALANYQKSICSVITDYSETDDVYAVPPIDNYIDWFELSLALKAKADMFADFKIEIPHCSPYSRLKIALQHYIVCDSLISQVRKEMKTKSDKLSLGEIANEVYKGAVNVCLSLTDFCKPDSILFYKESAFRFSEKNKASVLLEALASAEAQKFSGIPSDLSEEEYALRVKISYLKKQLSVITDSIDVLNYRNHLFNVNRKYDSLIYVFEQNYTKYYDLKYNQKFSGYDDIQKITDKKTAVLSYFTGDSLITVFVITKNKFDYFSIPKTKNFNILISNMRDNISNTTVLADDFNNETNYSVNSYIKSASELFQMLFPNQLLKFLGKRTKNLIIIPDGELALIPFECLLSKEYDANWTDWSDTDYFSEMPFLVKDYNISYSYSANLYYETSPKSEDKPEFRDINDWLALAPVFDNDSISGTNLRTRKLIQTNSLESGTLNTRAWLRDGTYISPLPGSEEETKNIFKIFEENNKKAVLKTHKYANEEYIKSGVLKDFRFLHIATHGMVNEDKPELSCILLAQDTTSLEDNILFLGEIYNLELNADLTVLSACETGLGKIEEGEGVIGLTRALLYAGSKNIIVSLWQVSDESTNQLMVDFYKNIFEDEEKTFSEHLSKSKLKLINEGQYAHPFFWSPFVLIGK
jgi:CHAT domain-containing protein/tetratricopeptide (TPR) repeat protein